MNSSQQMSASAMLESTAQALVAAGKGLLAADESLPTIGKRFKEFGIPCTEESRRAYRELLFTTPRLSEFISGVILFDETIRQKIDGAPVPEVLAEEGIIPGIKVDKGTIALPGSSGEKMTQGLDGLGERLAEYRRLGARFTKWRAVLAMGKGFPSRFCLAENARALAIFAATSQEAGLVPIVEPEVLMDGAHTLAHCEEATSASLQSVFHALSGHVELKHMLLKVNMVVSGARCPKQACPAEVAVATLRCLRSVVPATVPGVVFLSGGQSPEDATRRLSAICAEPPPSWKLSFSFGRALQAPALKKWRGLPANIPSAQKELHRRAQYNSFAVRGAYEADLDATGKTL